MYQRRMCCARTASCSTSEASGQNCCSRSLMRNPYRYSLATDLPSTCSRLGSSWLALSKAARVSRSCVEVDINGSPRQFPITTQSTEYADLFGLGGWYSDFVSGLKLGSLYRQ